jgi:hypothetical protein
MNIGFHKLAKQEVSPPSPEPVCPMCCKPVFTDRAEGDTRELKAALKGERELRMKIVEFVNHVWLKDRPDVEDDGFGGGAVNPCLECGLRLMEVVRPGKVQCSLCG